MRRAVLLVEVLLAAGCGDVAGTTTIGPPATTVPPPTTTLATTTTTLPESFPLPTGADEIVLQLDYGVNQPDALQIASAYPFLTIYGDGRVIFDDRSDGGGAVPPLAEARLAPEGIQRLVAEAVRRGALDPLDRYGFTGIADGDVARFVVNAGTHQADFGVYGLGDRLSRPPTSPPSRRRRAPSCSSSKACCGGGRSSSPSTSWNRPAPTTTRRCW